MITQRQAKKPLSAGDFVFIIDDGKVEAQEVVRVYADSIRVTDGYLYFDEHGKDWYLTKRVAQEQANLYNSMSDIRR